jgi:DNA-binding transcriptional LysR family regulator
VRFEHNVVAESERHYPAQRNKAAGEVAMQDLNDIFYFSKIVEHGSLSAASIKLGVAKSLLSKHLSRLEAHLGVRLAQRTTRKLEITEIGMRFYERCHDALEEISRAGNVIDEALERPRGTIRMTGPLNFIQCIMASLLADFMRTYPDVNAILDATNREVDMISEGYDLALRIVPDVRNSTLVARSFRLNRHLLVASPELLERHGVPETPQDLRSLPAIGGLLGKEHGRRHTWALTDAAGDLQTITYTPRLLAEDVFVIKQAAISGCGIADLPPVSCRDEVRDGTLVQLLPDWSLPDMNLYALFPSRKGLTPAVRCFLDYLGKHLPPALDQAMTGTLRLSLVGSSTDKKLRRVS